MSELHGVPIIMSDNETPCRNAQLVERILWGIKAGVSPRSQAQKIASYMRILEQLLATSYMRKYAMRQFFACGAAIKLRCAQNELCVEKPRALSNFERVTYVHVRSRSENCFFLVYHPVQSVFPNRAIYRLFRVMHPNIAVLQ